MLWHLAEEVPRIALLLRHFLNSIIIETLDHCPLRSKIEATQEACHQKKEHETGLVTGQCAEFLLKWNDVTSSKVVALNNCNL